jgi:simple sugar transport system permease protein
MSTGESSAEIEAPVTTRPLSSLDLLNAKLYTWSFWKPIMWAVVSIVLSLIVSAVIMLLSGYDPLLAYSTLFYGMLIQPDYALYFATPLILTGLSVALAFRCGLFNIGAEGQLYMGSMAAAIVGYAVALPIIVHPLACLAVGAIAGGLWGFVPGLLKAYRGAHEVVTTMMLSYTAILFTQWLATYPLREPGQVQLVPQLPPILPTAVIPNVVGYYLHWGIALAIASVFAVSFVINRTVLGYEMRAVGFNRDAAECAGIDPRRNMALALGLSGALAGLAGSGEILGTYGRFIDHWSPGLGFDGITVAVLGRNHPWGCLLAAIFFGALRSGGTFMNAVARVPVEMVGVIQGLIVLFVAAPRVNDWLAKSGFGYAIWLKNEPKIAVPNFAALVFGAISSVLALGYCILRGLSGTLVGLFFLMAIVGVVSFGMTLSRYRRAPIVHVILCGLWLLTGTIDILDFTGVSYGTSVVMYIGGLMIAVALTWLHSKKAKEGRCQP